MGWARQAVQVAQTCRTRLPVSAPLTAAPFTSLAETASSEATKSVPTSKQPPESDVRLWPIVLKKSPQRNCGIGI